MIPPLPQEVPSTSICIVIPVLNDNQALQTLLGDCRRISGNVEIVVCDGGSDESPLPLCSRFGARLVESRAGRGTQLNAGAAAAESEILWFVHADCSIESGSLASIRQALEDDAVVGGAFRFSLVGQQWYKSILTHSVNFLSHVFSRAYGDQAFFIRRSIFEMMGRFPDIPIMEDAQFYRRMKKQGKALILREAVGISPRRWEAEGFLRATTRNFLLLSAFKLGVPANRLVRWYAPPRSGEAHLRHTVKPVEAG